MRPADPPIVQYWDTATVPESVVELVDSFRSLNPDLPHMLVDETGADAFIAEHLTGREVAAFRACAVPAMQADYFRYCAVLVLGGIYADADLRCLAPLRPLLTSEHPTLFGRPELPRQWQTHEYQWRDRVGPYRVVMNAFFAFPRRAHPLLELALAVATANVERRIADDVALATGPAVFTSLHLLNALGSLDAYVEYARGGVLSPSASLLCEVVGDWDRVAAAFDGVRMPSFEDSFDWVRNSEDPLPYKETPAHWVNFEESIYR